MAYADEIEPGPGEGTARGRAWALSVLQQAAAAQKGRLILWMPVLFGTGIGLYFQQRTEPSAPVTMAIFAAALASWLLSWMGRGRDETGRVAWIAGTALFLIVAGFTAAQARTVMLDTTMLARAEKGVTIEGTVHRLDFMEEGKGMRLVLRDVSIAGMPERFTPERVRLLVRQETGPLRPGDRVRVRAGLNAPAPPVAPGAFDFQRYAYFHGIGAFGFTYAPPEIMRSAGRTTWEQGLEKIRQGIMTRVRAAQHADAAPVAIALITGEMTAVSRADWDAMRISGLAHMLSISGMHIGMIAGFLFFSVRFAMALFPSFALYHPIKKYAAVVAFAGALFYTFLSGAPIPAIRSMIMTGLMLCAVMIDRTPFSVRTIALAAMAILIFWPEALWSASFQLSFAAMTALIVFWEDLGETMARWHRNSGFLRRAFMYFFGVVLMTLIASLATAPFSLYHFQQTGLYAIPANMAASPLMSFCVMPAALVACLLMPFGLEEWPLRFMDLGIRFVMKVAYETASWPHASVTVPALPFSSFLMAVAGALFLALWRGPGRLAGLLPLAVSIVLAVAVPRPDILVSADAKLMAVRDRDGRLAMSSRVSNRFSSQNWMRRNGQDGQKAERWPVEGHDEATGLRCDESGCRMEREGKAVAFSFIPSAQEADCRWADILVASYPVRGPCESGMVIDRFALWRNGAYAVSIAGGSARSITDVRGKRPWTVSPRR